jgi:predicted nuclease of predicted toxin-antitoxin system
MRFLVDECTGATVAAWLRAQGHDVFSVADEAAGLEDDAILAQAVAEDRILITNDGDFGDRIFRDGLTHRGVVYLRLRNERAANKIAVLGRLLLSHADQLVGRFVVVTEGSVRVVAGPVEGNGTVSP